MNSIRRIELIITTGGARFFTALADRLMFLAIRFAVLASGGVAPPPPLAGAHPKALPEGPGENCRPGEAAIQGNRDDRRRRIVHELDRSPLEPDPADEIA